MSRQRFERAEMKENEAGMSRESHKKMRSGGVCYKGLRQDEADNLESGSPDHSSSWMVRRTMMRRWHRAISVRIVSPISRWMNTTPIVSKMACAELCLNSSYLGMNFGELM